jgi:hypothetical protein
MKIFYSHSSRQKPLVREFQKALGKEFDSWIDENNLALGSRINLSLTDAIENDADIFVLFLCRDAAESEFVQKEYSLAREKEHLLGYNFIFTIIIDDQALQHEAFSDLRERKYMKISSYEENEIIHAAHSLRNHIVALLLAEFQKKKINSQNDSQAPSGQYDFGSWLTEEALPELKVRWEETIVGRPLSKVFICPPLEEISSSGYREGISDDKLRRTPVQFEDLVNKDDNYLILIRPEFGQSSLAKRLACTALENCRVLSRPRLPIIVDASFWAGTKPYLGSFVNQLKRHAPDRLRKKLIEMAEDGDLYLIIENIDLSDKAFIGFLAGLCDQYPANKYLFM